MAEPSDIETLVKERLEVALGRNRGSFGSPLNPKGKEARDI